MTIVLFLQSLVISKRRWRTLSKLVVHSIAFDYNLIKEPNNKDIGLVLKKGKRERLSNVKMMPVCWSANYTCHYCWSHSLTLPQCSSPLARASLELNCSLSLLRHALLGQRVAPRSPSCKRQMSLTIEHYAFIGAH